MTHAEIRSLMQGIAPVIREFVGAELKPLHDRLAAAERQLAAGDEKARLRAKVREGVDA
jgi:hypothetical protein